MNVKISDGTTSISLVLWGLVTSKEAWTWAELLGFFPVWSSRAFVHPTAVCSSPVHSQRRNQVLNTKDSFNTRADTINHKSIDLECSEAFICHLEIF